MRRLDLNSGQERILEILLDAKHNSEESKLLLVADDEPALREIANLILKQAGYQVLQAVDGDEAVQAFRDHQAKIALVLLDMSMPKKNGYQVMQEILELKPDAKVIIASGYNDDSKVKEAHNMGASGFIAKPFRAATLLSTVEAVLNN
jgi:two-component system cell cycle sensor histidine kinase/response regulator CckA